MDWFEKITGFRETDYETTRSKLDCEGSVLRSRVNGQSYGIGELEVTPLHVLRQRARSTTRPKGRLRLNVLRGDVRQMHSLPENNGALFQVASQFNMLEMTSPEIEPEQELRDTNTIARKVQHAPLRPGEPRYTEIILCRSEIVADKPSIVSLTPWLASETRWAQL